MDPRVRFAGAVVFAAPNWTGAADAKGSPVAIDVVVVVVATPSLSPPYK